MNLSIDKSEAPHTGVYYQPTDYAGFWRRLAIDVVDIVVMGVVWLVLGISTAVLASLVPHEQQLEPELPGWATRVLMSSFLVMAFAYFVLLKRSRFRTLGYKLCGARIVNLQGDRPSVYSLTIRLLFAVFGPLNLLLDLIWIPTDECRQALRDKFAHTYVVRFNAAPEGRGTVVYTTYFILGWAFLFPEIKALHESGAP